MTLLDAIEIKRKELLKDYREVYYKSNEIIKMCRNGNMSEFLSKECCLNSTEVEIINDRFNELDDTYVDAAKVVFEVKRPKKRKIENIEVYYKII